MLDAVFNHIGDKSPQWQDVLKTVRIQGTVAGFT